MYVLVCIMGLSHSYSRLVRTTPLSDRPPVSILRSSRVWSSEEEVLASGNLSEFVHGSTLPNVPSLVGAIESGAASNNTCML